MRKRKRKTVGRAVLTGLAVLLLAAYVFYGRNSETENEEDQKITIRVLHYFGDTDVDYSAVYLKEILNEEFPKAFPNVELVQETCDNLTYKHKMKVLMASDEAPDIMFSYGAGFSENFVDSGKLLPLDGYLDDFYISHIDREMQENFIYDDTLYGICYSYWTGVLYCNMELFEQVEAEIPQTYEELIEVSRLFRRAGIEPIACGMVNKWQGQQWINNFTIQLGGAELYNDLAAGRESLDNEVLKEAAGLAAKLVSEGVFCSDMYEMESSEAEDMFLNGEAAMIYVGSWYTEYAEEHLGERLEVAKMPAVPGAIKTNDYHGGAINGWVVSADTEYPETAANIAAWIGYQLSCYQPGNAAFVIEDGDEKREISETDKKILELYQGKGEGGAAWDTLMPSERSAIWLDMCSLLFEGKVDEEEFVEELVRRMA